MKPTYAAALQHTATFSQAQENVKKSCAADWLVVLRNASYNLLRLGGVAVCCKVAAWVGLMTCSKALAVWPRLPKHALPVTSHRQIQGLKHVEAD